MIKPGNMWKKIMFYGKPLIDLMSIRNTRECDVLSIGEVKAHFITHNKVIVMQDNKLFLFWFEHRRLHGIRLQ